MLKKILFIFLILNFNNLKSQTFKINFGRTISSINSSNNDLKILDETVNTFNSSVGIDLLESRNYYISNEISYTKLGGKERNVLLAEPYNDYDKKWDFISISSSFRYKFNIEEDNYLFIGLGGKLRKIVGSKDFSSTLYENTFKINNYNFGIMPELGFVQSFNNKFQIWLIGSYEYSLTPFSKTGFNTLRINPIIINLSFGYKL